jgi:hypothetical protein
MRTSTSRGAVLRAALAIPADGLLQATATASSRYDGAHGMMLRSSHHNPMGRVLALTSTITSSITTRFRGNAELFA